MSTFRHAPIVCRRALLALMGLAPLALTAGRASATTTDLSFDDLYGKISVLGLEFSDKVKRLTGSTVEMGGFMAPPLKAEAKFFVLTEIPMSICPFCSSDSDWPDNIVVVYLDDAQTFEEPGVRINVTGTLEMGTWVDPDTGFLSRLRIRNASFQVA